MYPSGLCLVMESLCGFRPEISDRVVQRPRISHDIVLRRLQTDREGEEAVAESSPGYIPVCSATLQTVRYAVQEGLPALATELLGVDNTLHGGLLFPGHGADGRSQYYVDACSTHLPETLCSHIQISWN